MTEPLRRHKSQHKPRPTQVRALPEGHPAVVEGRTLFPNQRVSARSVPRALIDGINHRKLGNRVVKGAWKGMRMYALTLEERATCPRTCHHWRTCYGASMPYARRVQHGPELVARLDRELAELQREHPQGFVVRLHILGDFYAVAYVDAWRHWLDKYPALHVFGFSAWKLDTEIGDAVAALATEHWDRFAVRQSVPADDPFTPAQATTIWREPDAPRVAEGIVCPAQTGRTDCCGTCALCWSPAMVNERIVFIAHGPRAARTAEPRMTASPNPEYDALLDDMRRLVERAFELGRKQGREDAFRRVMDALRDGAPPAPTPVQRDVRPAQMPAPVAPPPPASAERGASKRCGPRGLPVEGSATRRMYDYLAGLAAAGAPLPYSEAISDAVGISVKEVSAYIGQLRQRGLVAIDDDRRVSVTPPPERSEEPAQAPLVALSAHPESMLAKLFAYLRPYSGRRMPLDREIAVALKVTPENVSVNLSALKRRGNIHIYRNRDGFRVVEVAGGAETSNAAVPAPATPAATTAAPRGGEQDAIEEFIRRNGVTKCPPATGRGGERAFGDRSPMTMSGKFMGRA